MYVCLHLRVCHFCVPVSRITLGKCEKCWFQTSFKIFTLHWTDRGKAELRTQRNWHQDFICIATHTSTRTTNAESFGTPGWEYLAAPSGISGTACWRLSNHGGESVCWRKPWAQKCLMCNRHYLGWMESPRFLLCVTTVPPRVFTFINSD